MVLNQDAMASRLMFSFKDAVGREPNSREPGTAGGQPPRASFFIRQMLGTVVPSVWWKNCSQEFCKVQALMKYKGMHFRPASLMSASRTYRGLNLPILKNRQLVLSGWGQQDGAGIEDCILPIEFFGRKPHHS